MVKVELIDTTGKSLGFLDFPTRANEITYNKFIDFEVAYQEKEKWLKESEKENLGVATTEYKVTYFSHVAKIINAFVGDDRVFKIRGGNYEKSLMEFFGVKSIEQIDWDTTETTLFQLYSQIWRTMADYDKANFEASPHVYEFEYKGEKYFLPGAYRDAITNNLRFENVNAAAAIEAFDAVRVYKHNQPKDTKGSFLFTTVLHLIACFALRENEKFPDTEMEIQKFVAQRVIHFQDIPMDIALNVKDFFLFTPKVYKKIQGLNFSLSLLKNYYLEKARNMMKG